jgi:outer membrane receptor protein involved in Fe transport
MFDLNRVEILRGPQGTLFGSSSMGGTVRLITNQPNIDETEAKVGGEISTTSDGGLNYGINAMVNVPTSDNSALRVVASRTDRDGFIDRVYDDGAGTSGVAKDVDSEETTSVRAMFRFNINDSTWIQPAYFYQDMSMDGKPNFDGPASNTLQQIRRFDAAEPFDDEFSISTPRRSIVNSTMSRI